MIFEWKTTAFLLMGWDDEKIIRGSLSRLHSLSHNSMLTDRGASPPAWTPGQRVQACRSGESAIAAEALMNNAG